MATRTAFDDIRASFPVLSESRNGRPLIYLDSAAKSLTPTETTAEIVRYHRTIGANIHRGKHFLSEEASNHFESVRTQVARFVGSRPDEIVFTRNTTDGLNIIAAGLQLERDDLVIVTADAHHSNLLPWRSHARTASARVTADGEIDMDHYRSLMKLRPRVVALTHCSNVTGVYAPIRELAALAHEAGALVVCDSAQYAPHRQLRVQELGVDAVAFSMHKMLGPTGVGILYASNKVLESLKPTYLGGGTVDWVDDQGHRLRKLPHRLEAGTPNIDGVYGTGAALSMLSRVGLDRIAEHDRELSASMIAEASKRAYLRVLGSGSADRCAIASMVLPDSVSMTELALILSDAHGIMCRIGHLCAQPIVDAIARRSVLRFSAYLYNTPADIVNAFAALDETVRALR